jgi:hypothetical protein
MLGIFCLLILLGAVIVYLGDRMYNDFICVLGATLVIGTIFCGFGMIGCLVPVGDPSYKRIAPTEIIIGNVEVIVKFYDNDGKTMSEIRDNSYFGVVNAKSNNIEVLRKGTKNSYGWELNPIYSIVTKEK